MDGDLQTCLFTTLNCLCAVSLLVVAVKLVEEEESNGGYMESPVVGFCVLAVRCLAVLYFLMFHALVIAWLVSAVVRACYRSFAAIMALLTLMIDKKELKPYSNKTLLSRAANLLKEGTASEKEVGSVLRLFEVSCCVLHHKELAEKGMALLH